MSGSFHHGLDSEEGLGQTSEAGSENASIPSPDKTVDDPSAPSPKVLAVFSTASTNVLGVTVQLSRA